MLLEQGIATDVAFLLKSSDAIDNQSKSLVVIILHANRTHCFRRVCIIVSFVGYPSVAGRFWRCCSYDFNFLQHTCRNESHYESQSEHDVVFFPVDVLT